MPATRLGSRFATLWAASTVSALGTGVSRVAVPLLLASMSGDPLVVSGAVFAGMLPFLLFSLLSGGLVDRLDRRVVMVVVDWVRGAAMGGLAVAVATGRPSVPLLYAVTFLIGTGDTLHRAAETSMVATIVPKDLLERANGRFMASRTVVAEMVAGPLGGFLFATAHAVPFALDAVTFVVAAALLMMLSGSYRATPEPVAAPAPGGAPAPGAAPAPRTSLYAEIREGLRWLLAHRLLRTFGLLIGLLNVTLIAATSVLVLLATQRLGLGSVGYGALYTALAVGALAGSLAGEWLIRRFTATLTLRVGLIIETAFHLILAVSTSPIVVGAAFAVFGVHAALWTIVTGSLLQRLTPPAMMGRVNSTYLFLAAGGNAFGALLGGAIATWFGLTAPYWIGFVVAAAVTALTWREFDRKTIAAAYAPSGEGRASASTAG
jgi:MFS family permease